MVLDSLSSTDKLRSIYQQLKAVDDLSPNSHIDQLFTSLVQLVTVSKEDLNLSKTEVDRLRAICSEGESKMELFWAQKIIASQDPEKTLTEFTYFQNYIKLTSLEWSLLLSCSQHPKMHRVIFIGGGPLPLTAILLARIYGVKSLVIDIDQAAVLYAQKLIRKLRLTRYIKIECVSAQEYKHFDNFSVIYLAALAGHSDQDKKRIISLIKKRVSESTHIIARSSYGNRRLLYRPIPNRAISGLEKVEEYHPRDDVINSVLILRKGK